MEDKHTHSAIICIGEALIDMICTDKGQLLSKGEHFLKKAGGAPTNVAAAIAALGGNVQLVAKVGADPFGDHLMQTLQDFGVDVQFVKQDPAFFTTLAFVSLMENGERDFYFNRGADAHLNNKDLEGVKTDSDSIVHFGSATAFLSGDLYDSYFTLLDKAKSERAFISFDPNYRQLLFGHQKEYFSEEAKKIIARADLCKVSDEEALLLTGKDTFDEAVKVLQSWDHTVWTITIGSKGTMLLYKGQSSIVPSIPVEVTDTTGAGDAFIGALLFLISALKKENRKNLTQSDWESMIIQANKAGARTCMYMGAMEAFKHLNADIFK